MATATKARRKTRIKLRPLADRVVVQRDEADDRTSGGIVLPDTRQSLNHERCDLRAEDYSKTINPKTA